METKNKEMLDLLRCIDTLQKARFVNLWGKEDDINIEFITDSDYENAIKATPISKYQIEMVKDLNNAIEPVLKKYIRICAEELKKMHNEQLENN